MPGVHKALVRTQTKLRFVCAAQLGRSPYNNLIDYRNPLGYTGIVMIKSFKHKGLEQFFFTGNKRGINPEHSGRLERLLDRLNAANDIKDMNYPGSFLHQLKGDKEGQYSVRVSGNWRVFFEFIDGDAYIVDYADYH
jgi:proteic killer suppression protein